MAYQATIPLATDLQSQSQDDIKNNFVALKDLIDINHITFDTIGVGKHFFVQFPVQSPVPVTGGGEMGIYAQTSLLTGNPELVISNEGSTYIAEFTGAKRNEQGYAILPSAIIMKWGSGTVNANTTAVATFAAGAGIEAFTTIYNVQVTREGTTGDTGVLYCESFTIADITVFNTADTAKKFYYSIIGV